MPPLDRGFFLAWVWEIYHCLHFMPISL
uniref:Uncharacterized protein n=1 Tax=Rhizophora mucronata TaxID=61149 RepID=A0A2P2N026_RHIMU